MVFEHSYENEVNIFKLSGRLTAANSKQLRAELKHICKEGGTKLVMDIAALEFMDSTGLGILVGWLQKARSEQGDIVLLNPTPEIKVLLELTRLDQIFSIYEDRQTATESFH